MNGPYYGPLSLMPDDLVWSMTDYDKYVPAGTLIALNQPVLAVPMPVGNGETVLVGFIDEGWDGLHEPDYSDLPRHGG